ncbi:hypothetical protein [uncultured Meiothermus sp.]|jgi:hypothetical protein|uniref:DUF6848 family protein n=1 Tax=uncultured Meiothermus sp. TaxID=157471 RepID=UPI0026340396|nr:hypothetical protein [uncultured Meiothermus sp.]
MAEKTVIFHTFETPEGKTVAFQKPTVAQIDVLVSKIRKSAIQATANFTLAIVQPDQRAAWEALLADKPGYASDVTESIMEKLGFPMRG